MTTDSRPESRRTERVEARVTPDEKELFQRVMLLSAADSRRVAEALIDPPRPTEALRRAARRYRTRTTRPVLNQNPRVRVGGR